MSARHNCPHCHCVLPESPTGSEGVSICPGCRANLKDHPVLLHAPKPNARATKPHPQHHRRKKTKPLSKYATEKIPMHLIVGLVVILTSFLIYIGYMLLASAPLPPPTPAKPLRPPVPESNR